MSIKINLNRCFTPVCVALILSGCNSELNNQSLQQAEPQSTPEQQPEYYGTLEPFAEEAVYFVVTDRFVDGDSSNNYPDQGGEFPTFNRTVIAPNGVEANLGYMGGDFKGIVDQAGYLREMGFTSVWITPVVENPDQSFSGGSALGEDDGEFFKDKGKTGYHGYWGTNFYQLDEHLPSEGLGFPEFARSLKDQGFKIVLDIVGNHGSPSFSMPEDQAGFGEVYDIEGNLLADHQNLHPEQLDSGEPLHQWFHQEEDIAQLSNFNENNPELVDYLVNSYLYWIDQGADALRIDTIRHMPNSFWKEMSDRVRQQYPGLFMFGEHFSNEPSDIAQHMLPENGSISVLDFPGKEAMKQVFENPVSDFSELLDYLHLTDGVYTNPYDLMTFYDNHDMARMDASDQGFIDAHNWLFTSRGIPVVYYGSEIGFMRGAKEHEGNRNYFGMRNVEKARLSPIRDALISVANVRRESIALQRGQQINLGFEGQTASFLRVYQKETEQDGLVTQTALVLLNKGDSAEEIEINHLLSSGVWQNAISGETVQINNDSGLMSTLEPHSVQVWLFNEPVNNNELKDLLLRRNP